MNAEDEYQGSDAVVVIVVILLIAGVIFALSVDGSKKKAASSVSQMNCQVNLDDNFHWERCANNEVICYRYRNDDDDLMACNWK